MAIYKPDHRVTLRRAATGYSVEDISDDVVMISITKQYGQAAGGYQIMTTFNRRIMAKRYDEVIKPNDIIHIELDAGDGRGLTSRMFGLVSRVARRVTVNPDQSVTRRVSISGMDFGKMLIRHNCAADIEPGPGQVGPASIVRLATGMIFSGTASEITESIFQTFMINQVPWVESHMVFSAQNQDRWRTFDLTILHETGSVWAAMKRGADEPYNVLTTETHEGKLHIILEPYPFHPETGRITRKTLHEIKNEHIRDEDLGIDDNDRINYLWFKCDMVTIYNQGANFPLRYTGGIPFDLESIRRDGFQPFYPETNFVPPAYQPQDDASPNIQKLVQDRQAIFWNWYRRNHQYETGSLQIKGNPHIKAGDGILTEDGMEYFVEGYTENYRWGEGYTTALHLTRGQKHG